MSDPSNPHGPASTTGQHAAASASLEAWLMAQGRDIREIAGGVEQLKVGMAVLQERTGAISQVDARLRTVEEHMATVRGLGRASAQGVTWVLPVALALLGVLSSVIVWLATRR